jgi:cytochrome c553
MPVRIRWRRSRAAWLAVAATVFANAVSSPLAAQTLAERLQLCVTCHGETGNSKMENTPSLAGQPELFITNQLILMREGVRKSEVMAPFVKGLKDDVITAMATHFAKLRPEPPAENTTVDAALAKRGAQLAVGLHCASCHRPDYAGQEQMPRLAHQRIDYLILSLTDYREGRRSGIDTSMNGVMVGVSDPDIRALAHYLATVR